MNENEANAKLLVCESEPIHIPGAIQPFGILLAVTRPNLLIRNASENCMAALGLPPAQLINHSLAEFVADDELDALRTYLERDNLRDQTPLLLHLFNHDSGVKSPWEFSAHEHAGCLIIELEKFSNVSMDSLTFHRKIRDTVQSLQAAGSLQHLVEAAVQQVKNITGFDRVMFYRFTEDWHGVVIAETCEPHMHAYLGHHFPASDIPAQARAIFLQNWLRMIPDVDYTPVPIFPGLNPFSGAPLDLGSATLRSVSPIHVEYLRNMGVKATLTISIVDDGKLWGLIACHHSVPRRIDMDSRLGAKMVGQLVSSQLQLKQSLEELNYRASLRSIQNSLTAQMKQEANLVQGLIKYRPNMLDLAASGGAAVYYNDHWTLIGNTPTIAEIERLVEWLASYHPKDTVFRTDRLSKHFDQAAAYKDLASGVLAIALPKTERSYILWFRPQVATVITWAGKPDKAIRQEDDKLTLHPRTSFEAWQEVVSGTSIPWTRAEIEAAEELRSCILALDLRREFEKEQAARAQVERAGHQKENMVNMVSHDLRTPLSVTKMSLEYLKRFGMSQPEVAETLIERGLRAVESIERLASDILDIAKTDAGTLTLQMSTAQADTLVMRAVEISEPLASQKGVQLIAKPEALGAQVACDARRLEQVFNNLIGNALKFTPAGGSVTVTANVSGEEAIFCVADTGPGISPHHLEKIFDRFWQEDHAKPQGTGLGLSIVKGIIDRHHGRIWVESELGAGSRFYFSLKRKTDED